MIMNDFGYIAVTRMRTAEQQLRLEQDRLIRTARRTARERRAAERGAHRPATAAPDRGLTRGLRYLLGTLGLGWPRSAELSSAGSSDTCRTPS